MKVYAIIPARSGSKGLPDKNIKLLCGKELIAYSIEFAKKLGVDKIICSTDSEDYAQIARNHGADVPFLRSSFAAQDTAMEQDILIDLYDKFDEHNIPYPDIFVWLRPTFVFRDIVKVRYCIDALINNPKLTAARTVCETESRIYKLSAQQILIPTFDDHGKSMIRRQDIGVGYKVFSTDVFRGQPKNISEDFLGRNVLAVPINKICGLDIDDEFDFKIIETLLIHNKSITNEYI